MIPQLPTSPKEITTIAEEKDLLRARVTLKEALRNGTDGNTKKDGDGQPVYDQTDQDIYKEQIKQYVTRSSRYTANKTKLYEVIWGQFPHAMQAKLQSTSNFDVIDRNRDSLALLKEIRRVSYKFEA